MRSFIFIVLLFLVMTQNICLGATAQPKAQDIFRINCEKSEEKQITAALDNLLLSHPQVNELIRRIVAKKNEAVIKALIDQYMNQLPKVASKLLSSLKNSHIYKQLTSAEIEARTAPLRNTKLIQFLRANSQPMIDEALSTEINNVIEQLCSKLSPEDPQKCYFISKFIKSIISTSLQQKDLIDELIFCLFIEAEFIFNRSYQSLILCKMEEIDLASSSPVIHIIQGAKTCLAEIKGDQKELAIRINHQDLTSLPQVNVLKRNQDGVYLTAPDGNYKLAKETSSLEAILMHELIHMLHFVEDQETFNRDSKSDISPYWNFSNWQDSKVFSSLWRDVEEQRTVIGRQGFQDISELSMRLNANLPIRYPYLDISDTEVDKNIINAIVANYVLPTSVE